MTTTTIDPSAEIAARRQPALAAFWCRIPSRPNFGDFLAPWLVKQVTGRYPRFRRSDDPVPKLLVGGSIIAYATSTCTVWGSGIISRDDPVSAEATILAVRGPLTRRRALECGALCPEVLGDPALLLPRFYRPRRQARRAVGIVPHFSDMPRLAAARLDDNEGAQLIDPQESVETVIDAIASSEAVIASSLHGLIVSHAYGVPAVWVEFRPLPSGDRSKFRDYYASIGLPDTRPIQLHHGEFDISVAVRAELPARLPDLDALWAACPFRQ